MPAAVIVCVQIISALVPLIKAGSQAYADISKALSVIKAAQAEDRDLTDAEFTDLANKAMAVADELRDLAQQAEAELGAR